MVFVVLTSHDRYLKSEAIQAPLKDLTHFLPDVTPDEGTFVIDTADLFAALEGEGTMSKRSLERMCRLLQIPTEYLHNAGNDAHVSF